MQQKILVTGATGTVGTQLVRQLSEAGHHVRALTRNPAKANFPAGVEVVCGDLAVPQSIISALQGVTGLHLINFDAGTGNPQMLQSGLELIEAAKKAGVQRVTLLRAGERSTVEEALEASDLCWTYIQPVEFMANMLEWTHSIQTEGTVQEPYPDRKSAIVHEADIAAVAAAALTQEGHAGREYTITGPEVLSPRKMLQIIGEATGRNLTFIELSVAQARERWRAMGLTDEIIEFLLWAYGDTPPEGYTVLPTVEDVTGRPARSFDQWAREHAAAFRAV